MPGTQFNQETGEVNNFLHPQRYALQWGLQPFKSFQWKFIFHSSRPIKGIDSSVEQEEEKPPLEKMTQKDVMKFPIYGRCTPLYSHQPFEFDFPRVQCTRCTP
jgi:hypothetical protein